MKRTETRNNKKPHSPQQAWLPSYPSLLQTRLRLGRENDQYEREAEQVASKVMRSTTTRPLNVMRAQTDLTTGRITDMERFRYHRLGGAGVALDAPTQQFMEKRLGYDFSRVRIHADANTNQQAQALGAQAFTIGRHIGFSPGQYRLDSTGGRRLLAHELAHVVQQRGVTALGNRRLAAASASSNYRPAGPTPHHPSRSILSTAGLLTPMADTNVVQRQTTPAKTVAGPSHSAAKRNITYFKDKSITQHKLSLNNVQAAKGLIMATPVGKELLFWLEKKKLKINVYFVAAPEYFPKKSPDASGYFERIDERDFNVYVAAGYMGGDFVPQGRSLVWKKKVVAHKMTTIADTLFHELLHVWFVVRFPGRGSGHSSKVKPTSIAFGIKSYDEAQYDKRFLDKLKEFDAQQAKQLQRRRTGAGSRP